MPKERRHIDDQLPEYIGCFVDACEDAAASAAGDPDETIFKDDRYDMLADQIETILHAHGFLRDGGLSGPRPTALEQARLSVASHDIALRAVTALDAARPSLGIADDPDAIESMIEAVAEKAAATVINWLVGTDEKED